MTLTDGEGSPHLSSGWPAPRLRLPCAGVQLRSERGRRRVSLLVDHVTKRFGPVVALDDLVFEVAPGSVFGFLGANGAGKTTTMRIALGVAPADGGRSSLATAADSRTLPRATWGYLPEERGLYHRMTVIDQLVYFARLYGLPRDRAGARGALAGSPASACPDLAERRPSELSKGNQQKVQFIAAILHDPEVLLMDEPFTGLDPVNVALLREAFLELRDQRQDADLLDPPDGDGRGLVRVGRDRRPRPASSSAGSLRDVKRSTGGRAGPPRARGRPPDAVARRRARRADPPARLGPDRARARRGRRARRDPRGGDRPTDCVIRRLRGRRAVARADLHRARRSTCRDDPRRRSIARRDAPPSDATGRAVGPSPTRRAAAMSRRDPIMPNTGIVARREFRERVRSRLFLVLDARPRVLAAVVALLPLAVRVLDRGETVYDRRRGIR